MSIDNTIVASLFGLLNMGLGIWLKVLHDTVKSKVDQDEHDGTIRRLEHEMELRVDKGHCGLKEQLARQKFESIEKLFKAVMEVNNTDHAALKDDLNVVKGDMRETTKALAQINKCLALLSERIEKGSKVG